MAKADVDKNYSNNRNTYSSYQPYYTQDNNDNLYYYDVDTHDIVKVNMLTKEQEILENSDTLTIDYDGKEYSNMTINSIFYDSFEDTLVAHGYFNSNENFFETKGENFYCLYEFNTGKVRVYETIKDETYSNWSGNHYTKYKFSGVLNDGNYLMVRSVEGNNNNIYILDKQTGNLQEILNEGSYTSHYLSSQVSEYNGNLYFTEHRGLYEYDYNELTLISEMPFAGVINDKTVVAIDNCISIFKVTGEEYLRIMYEDIQVNDRLQLNGNKIRRSILLSSNDDIVFYDDNAKAFRIISKND